MISQFLASYTDPKEDVVQYGTQEKTVFKRTKETPHVIRYPTYINRRCIKRDILETVIVTFAK